MADAPVLGAGTFLCVGSSPIFRTKPCAELVLYRAILF